MDYRKKYFQFVVLCMILVFFGGSTYAASLKFDPSTISATTGTNFNVDVKVELGSDQATTVDVIISYDSTMFTLGTTPVTSGTFFPGTANVTNQPGKIYVAGLVNDVGTYRTGTGTVATISLKPLKSGTSNITFDCTPGVTASDSNIVQNDANSNDIINCSDNNSLSVTVSGASLSATPTPVGWTASNTPTPRSGTATSIPIGRLTQSISTYDATHNPITVYDANGNPITVTTSTGTPVKVYDANGNPITVYDANGNPIAVSLANVNPTALPQTGTFDNVMKYSLPGGIMLLFGGLLLLL